MKAITRLCILIACLASSTSFANQWSTLLEAATLDGSLSSGSDLAGQLYQAGISFNIIDGDGNPNNFSSSDTVTIQFADANGNTALDTGGSLSPDQLEDWAEQNSDALLTVIFGADIATTTSSQSNATAVSSSIVGTIGALSVSSGSSSSNSDEGSQGGGFTSKIMLNSESATIKSEGVSITSSNGLFAWANETQGGNEWGSLIVYKLTQRDDQWSTKSSTLGFIPFFKVSNRLADSLTLHSIFNMNAVVTYIESSLFENGAGYVEYGGGINFQPVYQVLNNWSVSANLGYQYSQKHIPNSLAPKGQEYFVDAINALDASKNISYGLGSELAFSRAWFLRVDMLQVKNSLARAGQDAPIYYTASTEYRFRHFVVSMGYKDVANIDDYSESAYMASVNYIF